MIFREPSAVLWMRVRVVCKGEYLRRELTTCYYYGRLLGMGGLLPTHKRHPKESKPLSKEPV